MSLYRLLCCFLLVMPIVSNAQERKRECHADVEKYCSQSKGSMQQATDCLLDHQKEISDACYDTLKRRMDNQQGLNACKQDVDDHCKGIQAGDGRIVRCLMDHQKDISDDCYDMLAKKAKGGGGK